MQRDDGSYESSNLPSRDKIHFERELGIHKVLLTRVLYVDDKENLSKGSPNEEVAYEGVVVGGPRSGQIITNIRDGRRLGGENNYSESVMSASTEPNVAREGGKNLSDQDGDVVYVQFLGGNLNYPVIVGGGTNFKIAKKNWN